MVESFFEVWPSSWIALFSAVIGLIFGSFANVLIARLPEGRSVVSPPSSCPKCGAGIRWYDNIPILGFLLLRGRCRSCQTAISIRYPLVEAMTALLFVASSLKYGLTPLLFVRDWPILLSLVAVVFIDLDHRIIPDVLSLGGLVLALLTAWMDPQLGVIQALIGAAAGFGFFYAMAWIYERAKGRSGLGGGDIKLLAMFGAFLGPAGVFCVVLVSSVLGSLIGIAWGLFMKAREAKGSPEAKESWASLAIPYGPFLVVGGLYYYFLGDWLWLQFTIPT